MIMQHAFSHLIQIYGYGGDRSAESFAATSLMQVLITSKTPLCHLLPQRHMNIFCHKAVA